MLSQDIDLEIFLSRTPSGVCRVEMRFVDAASETEIPPVREAIELDVADLGDPYEDARAYGENLGKALFGPDALRAFYDRTRTAAEARDLPLRLRFRLGAEAADLHGVRWELLRDAGGRLLAAQENIYFSRFMAGADWRSVKLRARGALRALIAVAAPSDLAERGLAEVDAEAEIRRATEPLQGLDVAVLGRDEPLTLSRLVEGLRDGRDILYLVAHGAISRSRGEPALFLQKDDGKIAIIRGDDLVERIAALASPPRLVVLASCESAAAESGDAASAQAALAPRLAEAGAAAVTAMQGKISMRTVEKMMPIFFRELLADGRIDRALAVARSAVREQSDFWMPALFTRLKRGRIWYEPGFSGDDDFAKWRSIVSSVRRGAFVPILGEDLGEHLFGSSRDLARALSDVHGGPRPQRDDLHRVAQYLSTEESRQFARDAVVQFTTRALSERRPESASAGSLPKMLDALLSGLDDDDPYKVLADLPAAVYVNACRDPMLIKALKAAGRKPHPLICDWRPSQTNHPRAPVYDAEPTAEEPVVHHVFGVLGKAESLVLTEDDVYDYLLATAEYKLLPTVVRGALTRGSLLFLGFRLDHWSFRVLFRLIMAQGGKQRLRDFAHVGVQIDPEEHSPEDAEMLRRALEHYFRSGSDAPPISLYWGSAHDFLSELHRRLETTDAEDIPAAVEEDEDDWLS